MPLLWNHFVLAFSALLPLINPFGLSIIFIGLVGIAPVELYKHLARRIAINTIIFMAAVELIGSAVLNFFGISLPIVQLAGGFAVAAMGWTLLNEKDSKRTVNTKQEQIEAQNITGDLEQKTFYPFTFPLTVGPGCTVVMLTLSAHASQNNMVDSVLAHMGLLLAVVVLSILVYCSCAYAPRITKAISQQTAHGMLRVIAFILLCIGVQIAWNGLSVLIPTIHH